MIDLIHCAARLPAQDLGRARAWYSDKLGLKPGPRVGEILKAVYEKQMDGTVTTLEDAIAEGRRLL